MAIPSGSGSEVLKVGHFTVTDTTDTKILDGVANHIYSVLSIIITETAGNAETFGLFLDPSASGTDYEIISLATALPADSTFVFNEKLILPLICYEIIFTELIQSSSNETNLIINISEDGWFGKTIGPYQHFSKAIFRAIESETYIIRSANKGISAFISPQGKIIKSLHPNEIGNIEFAVTIIKI